MTQMDLLNVSAEAYYRTAEHAHNDLSAYPQYFRIPKMFQYDFHLLD